MSRQRACSAAAPCSSPRDTAPVMRPRRRHWAFRSWRTSRPRRPRLCVGRSPGRLRGAMKPWGLVVLLVLAPVAQRKPTAARPASPSRRAPRGTVAVGDTVRDSLVRSDLLLPAESTYAQQWRLPGRRGETVTIDLLSDAFDAYLFLVGPGIPGTPPQDDDSGGRCNARLTVRLRETGDYFIVVTSSERRATGPFTLAVTRGARPASLTPCRQ